MIYDDDYDFDEPQLRASIDDIRAAFLIYRMIDLASSFPLSRRNSRKSAQYEQATPF
jgi:hypothetical protein